MAKLDNVYLEQRIKDALEHCKTLDGEYIVNTNFTNGFALALRNKKFVCIHIAGYEFEFNTLYGAGVFMCTGGTSDVKVLNAISNRVKEIVEKEN